LHTGLVFDEFKDRYSSRRNVGKSALLRQLIHHLAAHLDQLVVVVGQGVKEDDSDIDIRLLRVPRPVPAAAEASDEDLTRQLDGVIFVAGLVEGVLNTIDYLVSNFKILR